MSTISPREANTQPDEILPYLNFDEYWDGANFNGETMIHFDPFVHPAGLRLAKKQLRSDLRGALEYGEPDLVPHNETRCLDDIQPGSIALFGLEKLVVEQAIARKLEPVTNIAPPDKPTGANIHDIRIVGNGVRYEAGPALGVVVPLSHMHNGLVWWPQRDIRSGNQNPWIQSMMPPIVHELPKIKVGESQHTRAAIPYHEQLERFTGLLFYDVQARSPHKRVVRALLSEFRPQHIKSSTS